MDQQNQQVLDTFFKDYQPEDGFEIVLIIDRSGSMSSLTNDVIGGLNTFITEQQKEGGSHVSIVQFDHIYGDPQSWRTPVKEVPLFDGKSYSPRGSTALFDAIGRTISKMKEMKASGEVKGKVMFVIQTDGEENSSQEIRTKEQLTSLIDDARNNEGWEFIFLGADLAAFNQGNSLGFAGQNTTLVQKNAVGVNNSYVYAAAMTRGYRSDVKFCDGDIELMKSSTASGAAETSQLMADVYSKLDEQIKSKILSDNAADVDEKTDQN